LSNSFRKFSIAYQQTESPPSHFYT